MKSVVRIAPQGKVKKVGRRGLANSPTVEEVDAAVAAIQALIPLGLRAFEDALQLELLRLPALNWGPILKRIFHGPKWSRTGGEPGLVRWSQEQGSIYLLDQKVPVTYQRVRDRHANAEVPLRPYAALQAPRAADAGLFRKVLLGLSCRNYRACAEALPEAFGLSGSTVSRRFIRATAQQLERLLGRRLEGYDIVALILDGKTFADDSMVIALGITGTGAKVLLGFVQTATENERVCAAFLRELVERGLQTARGLLCVIDGAKGVRKAIQTVFAAQAVVQRCQWHKRRNVLAYLPKGQQAAWRRKLQAAYERPTYAAAKAALLRVRQELTAVNESAVTSLDEGFEETLTLHRLGVFRELGISLKTTNCLESIHALVEDRTGKVDHWRTSDQKRRWLAAALLEIEPRLRRLRGYRALPLLRAAVGREIGSREDTIGRQAA